MKKKTPGDINGLHKYIINDNYMMYRSWDMEHDWQIFLSFWTTFCPFALPQKSKQPNNQSKQPQKSKFSKNFKTNLELLSFYKCVPKMTIIWLRFLRYGERHGEFFVILGHFFPFYHPNKPKNQSIEKMKKTPGDIFLLQMCTINDNHMMYGSWDMAVV